MNHRNKIKRVVPQSGSCGNMIIRLEKYISPVDSEWHKNIEGVSDQKAEELKSVLQLKEKGYDFPNEYKEFLKYMGKCDGNLLSEWCNGIVSVNKLIELNPSFFICESENSFLFGINDIYSAEYYITFLENGEHFITTNFDKEYKRDGASENFEKLLFQVAFDKYEEKYFEYQVYIRNGSIQYRDCIEKYSKDGIISIIEETANKFSLQKVWFSDKWHFIACNERCSLYMNFDFAIDGWIFGDDKDEVERIAKGFSELLMLGLYKNSYGDTKW